MMGSLEQVESCHTEGHTLMFGTQRSILGQVEFSSVECGWYYIIITIVTLLSLSHHHHRHHHHQSLARDPGTLSKLTVLPCGGLGVDSDTYWNELHTSRLIMTMTINMRMTMTMTLACMYNVNSARKKKIFFTAPPNLPWGAWSSWPTRSHLARCLSSDQHCSSFCFVHPSFYPLLSPNKTKGKDKDKDKYNITKFTFVQTALLQSPQSKFFCRVKKPKFSPHKMPGKS